MNAKNGLRGDSELSIEEHSLSSKVPPAPIEAEGLAS